MNYLTRVLKERDCLKSSQDIGVYLTDGSAFTLGVNRAYERLTELEEKEVFGRNMKALEDEGFFDRSVTLLVLKHRTPVSIEQKILRTGKKVIVTGNPIFDKEGKVVLVVTTVDSNGASVNQTREPSENTISQLSGIDGVVATSKVMKQVLMRAVKAAATDSTVLIIGESGVGKEVVARVIHQASPRKSKPFIKVNVSAIPEELFESELFGYHGGAFTGALKSGKKGLVQAAAGGTLFLDEISEVPVKTQVKLLRLLQNKEVIPVGSVNTEQIDVRFLAATNRDLAALVKLGQFREDLFYRINVVPICIPPLRERVEDIYALATYFLTEICRRYKIPDKQFTTSALQALTDYSWPGNIRELQNLIERLVVLYSQPKITGEQILEELFENTLDYSKPIPSIKCASFDLQKAVDEFEKSLIERVFKQNNGNMERTAKALGQHRTTIMRKIRKYNIVKENKI